MVVVMVIVTVVVTVVVGGVRFAQARSIAVQCSEDPGLQALYSLQCFPSLQLSTRGSLGVMTVGVQASAL